MRILPAFMTPAAARPWAVYQRTAHDILAPLVGEIAPAPVPRARSFRDWVFSPLGRNVARLLIQLLIVTPLPREMLVFSALFPVSILWPLLRAATEPSRAEESTTVLASETAGGVCESRQWVSRGF